MKARLKVLPDRPRDGAWPPAARAVRCRVKNCAARFRANAVCTESRNERDLHLQLLPGSMTEHIVRTAFVRRRKAQATVSPYASNLLGYTRATKVETMGCDTER